MSALRMESENREAFLRHYEAYKGRIYTYFWYRTGFQREVAEDCTQDVFMKAFRAFPSFDTSREFGPWIFRIAHNHLVNTYRARRPMVPLEEVLDDIPAPASDDVECRLELQRALTGIARLDPQARNLLLLRYVEGYSHEEIAAIVGKRVGAVRVAVHRARERMRRTLTTPDATPREELALFARI